MVTFLAARPQVRMSVGITQWKGKKNPWVQNEAVCDWSHPLVFVWRIALWVSLDSMLICVCGRRVMGDECMCVCVFVKEHRRTMPVWEREGGEGEEEEEHACARERERGGELVCVCERETRERAVLQSEALQSFLSGSIFYQESGLLPGKVWVPLSHCLSSCLFTVYLTLLLASQ